MPVYECICSDCRKVSRIFTRSVHERLHPACSHCQGRNLRRKISRVVIAKGTRRAIQDLVRSRLMGRYEGRDKARQAAWSRRTANELGEAGSDFREMAEKAEAGEDVWDRTIRRRCWSTSSTAIAIAEQARPQMQAASATPTDRQPWLDAVAATL